MAGGRPPGQSGLPKAGGRKKGSLDKAQRQVVTSELAKDIMDCYMALGGAGFLLEWAKANKTEFVKQALARLFPAFDRQGEGDGNTFNTQINFDSMTELDTARRVAFLLAKAAHDLDEPGELQPYVYEPARPYDRDCNPQEACHVEPEPRPDLIGNVKDPLPDLAREAWAQSLASTPEEQLVRETIVETIESYRGSAAEQGVAGPARVEPRRRR